MKLPNFLLLSYDARASVRAIMLIECMVYLGILTILVTLGFGAFIGTVERSTRLERSARVILQAAQAGERWREDIRLAGQAPRLMDDRGGVQLVIPVTNGTIAYRYQDQTVQRRIGTNDPWQTLLEGVAASTFHTDRTSLMTSWRWELELMPSQPAAKVRPLFSYLAVPAIVE